MSNSLLNIKNLYANANDKKILDGLNLEIKPGEVHAIMGPNGSGKSTLANILARNENYNITSGEINFLDKDLINLTPEECAQLGLFLSFQYPVAIPGISNIQFLKTAVNSIRKVQGKKPYDAVDFLKLIKSKLKSLNMSEELLYRSINDDFSGGEKKRNEILQMILLEPKLAILDETDSGLDIDALKDVAYGVNEMRSSNRSFLLITHYKRLLEYIKPDYVHILAKGKIIKSAGPELAEELEQKGYSWVLEDN